MFSPYEELEYLADYLPEEGESVLITRQSGELICRPHLFEDLRDGVEDAEFYGFLVQANERLYAVGTSLVRGTVAFLLAAGLLLYGPLDFSWAHWYVLPGLAIPVVLTLWHWVQHRRQKVFRQEIIPQLNRELSLRKIRPFALIAGVRQHRELRTLFDELVRWLPPRTSFSSETKPR